MEMMAVIGELKYGSYEFNRDNAPEIPAGRWKRIYGEDVEWMEERYLEEKKREANAVKAPTPYSDKSTVSV